MADNYTFVPYSEESAAAFAAQQAKAAPQAPPAASGLVQPQLIDPTAAGKGAADSYTAGMYKSGYIPTQEQAGHAFTTAQEAAIKHNMQVQSDYENKQRDIQAEQVKQQQAQSVVKNATPDQINKLSEYSDAWDALNNVEDKYSKALKSPFFGGNARGEFANPKFDDRIKQFKEAQELASTPLANGVLNYTAGADAKKAVMEKMSDILPNQYDYLPSGAGKILQLRQMIVNNVQNFRDAMASSNYKTDQWDKLLGKVAPATEQTQAWYNSTFNNVQGDQSHAQIKGMPQEDMSMISQLNSAITAQKVQQQLQQPAPTPGQ